MIKGDRNIKAIPRLRRCGCIWYGDDEPEFPCRDAAALQAAVRFAELLAAGMPDDPLCRRIAAIARAALDRHYRREPAVDIERDACITEPKMPRRLARRRDSGR
jgi:hypothetical protein